MPKSTKATPNAKPQEIGVLVGVQSPMTSSDIDADLDELEALLSTAGAKTIKRFTQNLAHPHPKYYIGKENYKRLKPM